MKDNFFDNLEDYKENEKVKCVNCGKEFYQTNPKKGCPYCNNLKELDTLETFGFCIFMYSFCMFMQKINVNKL